MKFHKLPRHLAIIMDGNGRWAEERKRPRIFGHIRGSTRVRELIRNVDALGIHALTLYAFSTENWSRPAEEVSTLMSLLFKWLKREQATMMKENIRFRAIGSIERMPLKLQEAIAATQKMSESNTGLQFTLALSYGSRSEIVKAAQKIAEKVARKEIESEKIDEALFAGQLDTHELGDPDLLIRTSGEKRVSNFLLWQIAYAEFYFTETKWPDFGKEELSLALEDFQKRDRRFGNVLQKAKNQSILVSSNEL